MCGEDAVCDRTCRKWFEKLKVADFDISDQYVLETISGK